VGKGERPPCKSIRLSAWNRPRGSLRTCPRPFISTTKKAYGKLRQEFPGDYQMRVERLSEYMASTGRSYKNHLATIRSWAKREKPKYNPADYTFEEGDSL